MLNILFAAGDTRWPVYATPLKNAFAAQNLDVYLGQDLPAAEVDYIIYAPDSTLKDFTPYLRCKGVMNIWAGVEAIAGNATLTQPLCRMVDDDGLTQSMVEWVTGHVLRHHLGMDAHIVNPKQVWESRPAPVAPDRKVTILGLGALGSACALMLAQLGFQVTGWSRSAKSINAVRCLSGDTGLTAALEGAEIVVTLLPSTAATENILNADRLDLLATGACIINPGRGPLIDDTALLLALNSGQVGHATLDVFRKEPLPQDDPYWAHPNVTVTPHIAAETRPTSAACVIAANINGHENGAPLQHMVDRKAGY